jgi:small subunit ribosomal protein S6e
MVEFKVVINDKSNSYKYTASGDVANVFIGKKIGDEIDGTSLNMPDYKFTITGGSDKDGFPMSKSILGGRRAKVILSKGFGFNPDKEGLRKKKSIRGNVIFQDISQINMRVTKAGSTPLDQLLPKEKKE